MPCLELHPKIYIKYAKSVFFLFSLKRLNLKLLVTTTKHCQSDILLLLNAVLFENWAKFSNMVCMFLPNNVTLPTFPKLHFYSLTFETHKSCFSCFVSAELQNKIPLLGRKSLPNWSFCLPVCTQIWTSSSVVGGCWVLLGLNWSGLGFSVWETAAFEVLKYVLWSAGGSPQLDRSIMGKGDCWLIPQGKEKDMIRQMLERKLEEKILRKV